MASSTRSAIIAIVKARGEIAFGGKFPKLAPTPDFVFALQTAQFWAEASPFNPTSKEACVDLIQYGLRGHAAQGV